MSATLDHLAATVAYILSPTAGRQATIGTGFFFASANERPYLVTAAHVAKDVTPSTTITVRTPGDIPASLNLSALATSATPFPWRYHAEADVAILPLTLTLESNALLAGRFIGLDHLQANEEAPARERPVTVMGFPLALGTKGKFSPITSEAKPASGLLRIPRADTNTEATFFILDKPSVGGFSGAPVFLLPAPYSSGGALVFTAIDTPTSVVGLVHGTVSDQTGGKFAAIVPASFIRETVLAADQA